MWHFITYKGIFLSALEFAVSTKLLEVWYELDTNPLAVYRMHAAESCLKVTRGLSKMLLKLLWWFS